MEDFRVFMGQFDGRSERSDRTSESALEEAIVALRHQPLTRALQQELRPKIDLGMALDGESLGAALLVLLMQDPDECDLRQLSHLRSQLSQAITQVPANPPLLTCFIALVLQEADRIQRVSASLALLRIKIGSSIARRAARAKDINCLLLVASALIERRASPESVSQAVAILESLALRGCRDDTRLLVVIYLRGFLSGKLRSDQLARRTEVFLREGSNADQLANDPEVLEFMPSDPGELRACVGRIRSEAIVRFVQLCHQQKTGQTQPAAGIGVG